MIKNCTDNITDYYAGNQIVRFAHSCYPKKICNCYSSKKNLCKLLEKNSFNLHFLFHSI